MTTCYDCDLKCSADGAATAKLPYTLKMKYSALGMRCQAMKWLIFINLKHTKMTLSSTFDSHEFMSMKNVHSLIELGHLIQGSSY